MLWPICDATCWAPVSIDACSCGCRLRPWRCGQPAGAGAGEGFRRRLACWKFDDSGLRGRDGPRLHRASGRSTQATATAAARLRSRRTPRAAASDRESRSGGPRAASDAPSPGSRRRAPPGSGRAHDAGDLEKLLGVVGAARAGRRARGRRRRARAPCAACRAAIHASGLNQYSAQASCATTCVRQSRRFTCASSCSSTMRRRSSGQRSASAGIRTDGREDAPGHRHRGARASKEARRGVMPSSAASSMASGSHGASTTRTVRRDIHCTATRPRSSRAMTAMAPMAQIATRQRRQPTGSVAAAGAGAAAAVDWCPKRVVPLVADCGPSAG